MASVEKVNLSNANQVRFMAQPENSSEVKESSVKKYFTAPNIILGSLATVGVLGMADVLICRGKHLNKITGKGKELEEALSRASNAENRATALESEASKIRKQLDDLIAQLKRTTQLEGDLKITGEGKNINLRNESMNQVFGVDDIIHAPLHNVGHGCGILRKLQDLYSEISELSADEQQKALLLKHLKLSFKNFGYKVVEEYNPEKISYEIYQNPNLKAPVVKVPAIIDKNGNTILKGTAVVP